MPNETINKAVRRSPKKDERVYIRTTREQKEALERAAFARHIHTTEFVLQASLNAAEAILAQEEKITLSERDFARFVELIENPKPPTQNLRDLMAEYQRLKADNPNANL
jgi:uncharacterized protein (DUF1778 family)